MNGKPIKGFHVIMYTVFVGLRGPVGSPLIEESGKSASLQIAAVTDYKLSLITDGFISDHCQTLWLRAEHMAISVCSTLVEWYLCAQGELERKIIDREGDNVLM